MEQIINQLERGTLVTKFSWRNKKTEIKTLAIRRKTRQIVWSKAGTMSKWPYDGFANLRQVKEIRLGKFSKDFDEQPDTTKKFDNTKCFVVLYGCHFKLRTLSIAALSEKECELWTKGLRYLVRDTINDPYPLQVDTWLRREFYAMESQSRISLKEVKSFLPKLPYKMSTTRLQKIFDEVDNKKRGEIEFDGFATLYHKMIFDENNIYEIFDKYRLYSSDSKTVTLQEFQRFLIQEQRDEMGKDEKKVSKLISGFIKRDVDVPYFTISEFLDFLFSKQNDLWDSSKDTVYQDMTRPLSHYYISSSHNTYLTGAQIASEVSVEAYVRCLRMGCRCIELDCWNGPDDTPEICHGTLTTSIKLIDVIRAIKEHAFVTSEYPVILSIEDNCNVTQQKKIASAMQEVFGKMLLIHPMEENEMQLPSPHQLRRKIILKHKKLPDGQDEDSVLVSSEGSEVDLASSTKRGVMYVEDPIDHEWNPHYFVLTNNKLFYTDTYKPDQESERSKDEEDNVSCSSEELHISEKWFHGCLPKGRHESERLVKKYSHLGEGTFLVRASESYVGEYCLSFWGNGSVHHSLINQDKQQTKYNLIDTQWFDSLYSLITHYRSHSLVTADFSITLREPVPQPNPHEGQKWYHQNTKKVEAEAVLKMIKMEGAFLVRHSEKNADSYAISFRANKAIKHLPIKFEGKLYTIGNIEFKSLVDLIDYFGRHPLYRKVKLSSPVSEDSATRMAMKHDYNGSASCMDPTAGLSSQITVRAIYDYEAQQPDELSFCKNAIITNVTKPTPNHWKGNYDGKRQLYFFANYVQEIDRVDLHDNAENEESERSMLQGSLDMNGALVELNRTERPGMEWELAIVTSSTACTSLNVAVQSKDVALEWYMAIREAAENASALENQNRGLERTFRIAQEISQLIVYCRAVTFNIDRLRHSFIFYEMSSFHETRAERLICNEETKFFLKYHQIQLSRIYPKEQRIFSSNYNPINLWNCGAQMVALNFQTGDKPMQLNQAKFRDNANCGYLLKPQFMFRDNFDPKDKNTLTGIEPMTVSIRIIGARHLGKSKKGLSSPSVEVEVIGAEFDSGVKLTTKAVADNGLNPIWNEDCKFEVANPELALLRFLVRDEDTIFGEPNFVGQTTYPITCLRTGYRSVCLQNIYSEDLELGSLLIYIDFSNGHLSKRHTVAALN